MTSAAATVTKWAWLPRAWVGVIILYIKPVQPEQNHIWKDFPLCIYKVPCQLLKGWGCSISPIPPNPNPTDWTESQSTPTSLRGPTVGSRAYCEWKQGVSWNDEISISQHGREVSLLALSASAPGSIPRGFQELRALTDHSPFRSGL